MTFDITKAIFGAGYKPESVQLFSSEPASPTATADISNKTWPIYDFAKSPIGVGTISNLTSYTGHKFVYALLDFGQTVSINFVYLASKSQLIRYSAQNVPYWTGSTWNIAVPRVAAGTPLTDTTNVYTGDVLFTFDEAIETQYIYIPCQNAVATTTAGTTLQGDISEIMAGTCMELPYNAEQSSFHITPDTANITDFVAQTGRVTRHRLSNLAYNVTASFHLSGGRYLIDNINKISEVSLIECSPFLLTLASSSATDRSVYLVNADPPQVSYEAAYVYNFSLTGRSQP